MSTSVSHSNDSSPPKRARTGRKNHARRWVIIIATVTFSLLVFFIIRTQGHVEGEEFAPSHFQSRQFSFYEIPLLHVQITPIHRTGTAMAAATHIRQMLPKAPGVPKNWHLVTISRGLSGSKPADAQLLIDQLTMTEGSNVFWRKWSVDHPPQANVLWPIIQKLAKRELYVLVPSVLDLAQKNVPAAELKSQIDDLLRGEFNSLITDMREAKRGEIADQLLQEALSDYPNDRALQRLSPSNTRSKESGKASGSSPGEIPADAPTDLFDTLPAES